MQKLSLEALARDLLKRAERATSGRGAHTVVGGHNHVLRQTLVALSEGAEMAEHESPGEASLHVLRGRVRLYSDGATWDGRDGDLLVIPAARHVVRALASSVVLLTVAKVPGKHV